MIVTLIMTLFAVIIVLTLLEFALYLADLTVRKLNNIPIKGSEEE
mgnify:CR=1 FL=1